MMVLLVILFVAVQACSTQLPPQGVAAFEACDYDVASTTFQKQVKSGSRDEVLYHLSVLSAAMHAGDDVLAEKAGLAAQRIMWSDVGQGRGTASLVSAEAIKVFKGEPFEKAMASIYLGIIYFNRGDWDNARAAFARARMATRLKDREYWDDFALANYLLAKTYMMTKDWDNARIVLDDAKKRFPQNPYFDFNRLAQDNVIVLAELGKGPIKDRSGPGNSLVTWHRQKYTDQGFSVRVDQQVWQTSSLAGDLTYQAQTKGRTGKDVVQATKGALRDAATVTAIIAADQAISKKNETAGWVAVGAGLFALANQSQADIRHWSLLPDVYHVVSLLVPVVHEHKLEVKFRHAAPRIVVNPEGLIKEYAVQVDNDQDHKIVLTHSRTCRAK